MRFVRLSIALVTGVALLAMSVAVTVMLLAFRGRVPAALRIVRRFNRDVTNVRQLRTAGQAGSDTAVLRHRGRVTGAPRATPLGAMPVGVGFEIVLPYGRETDWLRNLQAAGSAVLEHNGIAYRVDQPEVVPIETTSFAERDAATYRAFRIREAVRIRSTPPPPLPD